MKISVINKKSTSKNYSGNEHDSHGITSIMQQSELGETLKELNSDIIEHQTQLSGIDMRSRLDSMQIPSMVALDTLIGLNVIPVRCSILNRSIMRKSISIEGKGRQEIVDIVAGKRELDSKSGLVSRMQEGFRSFMGFNR